MLKINKSDSREFEKDFEHSEKSPSLITDSFRVNPCSRG